MLEKRTKIAKLPLARAARALSVRIEKAAILQNPE
jgi:hypothetical protein